MASGAITSSGTGSFTGAVTANAGVVIDNFTIDGTEIDLSSGDLTVDVAGDIIFNADGGDFTFSDASVDVLRISNSSSDAVIRPLTDAKDIIFQQYDGTEVLKVDDDTNVYIGNDLKLTSDGAILSFGTDSEIVLTHVHNSGIRFSDSDKLMFGDSDDLTITHDGSNSIINDTGTGSLQINTSQLNINGGTDGAEAMASFADNGAVTLYYDNSVKFQTLSGGASVTGSLSVSSSLIPASADAAGLGTAALEWSDLYLADGGVIYFGNDQDVTLTHYADNGLRLKHTATADDKPIVFVLQTGETDIAANDVIGSIRWQAPDEGTGTDAVLVAGAIDVISEGDFSSSNNATKMSLRLGSSETATEKASLSSGGVFTATSFTGSGAGLTAGTTPVTTLDIDGATDIGAAIVDADLFIIDDGAGGTNRKVTASRIRTYTGFAAGTIMIFQQASAPTGWTKLTATNSEALADASIRVIGSESFNVGVNGSVAFTTAFASKSVAGNIAGNTAATTLQLAQIPAHTHTVNTSYGNNKQSGNPPVGQGGNNTQASGSAGGGGSHTHAVGNLAFTGTAINMAVKYVDVILASKDS